MLRIPKHILVPMIVACALFMENMDSTVIATCLPTIARDLQEDPIALKLALTSYLLSLAVFIPISGWMADRFGARTVFRAAIGVFMGGSVCCALSASLEGFVAARFLQGMGGAMMVPVGRLVVLRSTSKAELVQAMAYLTMPALLGPVIGPPLGGFIATYFHWRWIFFINIPISILGLYMAGRHIENLREDVPRPLDWSGFLLSALGLSALMLGLATAGRHLVSLPVSLACMAAGAALMVIYVWQARAKAYPLLSLDLLRIETFRAGVVGGFFFRIGIGAIPFLLPLFLQLGFGLNSFESGLLTCASAAGALSMKTIAAKILQRFGFRRVLIVNTALASVSLLLIGAFTAHTPHALIMVVLLVGGCFRSLQFTSLNALSYADVETAQMSQATSLASVVQQLAAGMGVTVGAFALQGAMSLQGHQATQAADFPPAFAVVALVSLTALLWLTRLPASAGAVLSGHRQADN
ncbi:MULTISPECIES: MFS transporter [unclassified Uliginosibacterium]|uniref:MFS transporter n=1 Tax=unclassified Uliginosibacterium TaxID=2621521 RepID=UPI001C1FF7D8|nr:MULTISPECIES: MFS transporter [unclassified Uliginosibacterium]MDO6387874.1 MFS transporter [Uliginosibacterium sp. 31-12]